MFEPLRVDPSAGVSGASVSSIANRRADGDWQMAPMEEEGSAAAAVAPAGAAAKEPHKEPHKEHKKHPPPPEHKHKLHAPPPPYKDKLHNATHARGGGMSKRQASIGGSSSSGASSGAS